MMHLFINALAASAGGGLTYVRNIVPCLGRLADVRATVLVTPELRAELGDWPNLDFVVPPRPGGTARRLWYEQRELPDLIRRSGASVLLSTGNFALWNSPVPQILLSRNALYTSSDFKNDLRRRGDYRLWLDTQLKAALARASIRRADVTVAPSEAFAQELREWTGRDVCAIHHGFDAAAFTADPSPLPAEVQAKLEAARDGLRLLFVSHYNYYRNFETLIRALPLLRQSLAPRKVRLMLTCRLQSDANPGSYRAGSAAALVQELGVSDNVVELGTVPYRLLHHVYRACDLYVTPAYAESFAHPLVEAMSMGLPVVASDIAVHREICGRAATYFSRFSPHACAVAASEAAGEFTGSGIRDTAERVAAFTWAGHIEKIVGLARHISVPSGG
jgi:glycosyltransferase involved in cell wall biosynthesis